MKIIAKKANSVLLMKLYLIVGALIMAAAVIVLPINTFYYNKELLTNLYVWGAVLIAMLFFGLVGFFGFIRPYILYRKAPDVQAETDGTYLYIYGKKEAKLLLSELDSYHINSSVPYIMTKEFIVHLFSENYGDIIIKVPHEGKYRLRFIADAHNSCLELIALVDSKK